MASSSFPGSSRRARAPANIAQVAHCLVDGCDADLSLCRDYHRRHKVCKIHSKTPKVSIGGQELRFCQQCSRFHALVEFDGEKRSCRKRLDGHNRRRRKSQPDSFTRNSGLDFSNQRGDGGSTRLLSFGTPQILPSAVLGFSWAGAVKTENEIDVLCNNQQQLNFIKAPSPFPECSAHSSYKGANQLQFVQSGSNGAIQEASICQPFLDPNSAAGSSSCGQRIFSDGLNQVVDSDGALSLLSSAIPATRGFSLNHALQAEPLPQAPSLVNNLQYSGLGHRYQLAQESNPVVSSADSHGSDASTLHFPEMFQHGAEGSSTSGSNQTLTFMWE